jgi:hypothetical protein
MPGPTTADPCESGPSRNLTRRLEIQICDPATRLRLEARCESARYLRAGTDYLSPLAVRRIIQVADEDGMGSLTAVCRLDREVHKLSATHPSEDPIEQMESVVHMYEEEILEWERTRTVHPDSDADPDPMQEPTGQKLVEALEKILAEDEAAECPPPRLADTAWMRQVLRQATKVSCLAEEICDTATKAGWQPCAFSIYRWRMEQEIRHLYACFGGPDEEEAVVKAQKKAKTWLTKAHKGVERARDHIGSHLREVVEAGEIQRHTAIPGLELAHFCRHDGPPGESRPCAVQADAAIQRACRAWEADPERLWSICGEVFEVADRSTWDKASTKYWRRQNTSVDKILASTKYSRRQNVGACAEASFYCYGPAESAAADFSQTSLMFSYFSQKLLIPPCAVAKCNSFHLHSV